MCPPGDECVGDGDADLTGQVVIAGAREAERVIRDGARLVTRRHLDRGDRNDTFEHPRDQWRGDAVIAIAPLPGDSDETRLGQLEEVLARGRTRDPGEIGKLAAGQGLPTHQGGKDGCARGIADERRNLDQICRRDHARILPLGPEAKQETRLRRAPNRSLATVGGLAAKVTPHQRGSP